MTKAVKGKRSPKHKALTKVDWDENDKICLIHALWGMLTPSQRSLMTVRTISLLWLQFLL